jgi:hypothetical protein
MNTTTLKGKESQRPFDDQVELFLQHLRSAG